MRRSQAISKSSRNLPTESAGWSTEDVHGPNVYIAFISSPENLKRLDEYKEMNRKLALGLASPAELDAILKTGTFDCVDRFRPACNRGSSRRSIRRYLAYRMLTDESEEARRIRENVILMQVPGDQSRRTGHGGRLVQGKSRNAV